MIENEIKISVIMPVYNSERFLDTAIESILSQSLKDFEVILIDDGSTDNSPKLCDEYSLRDNRIKVIHQQNSGICKARNNALEIATGEYIAFSDHDDEYIAGFLEHAYNEAKKHDADFVKVGKKEFVIEGKKLLRTKQSCLPYRIYHCEDIRNEYFKLVDSDELDCLWDGLFKKSLIDKYVIRLDEHFKNGGEDIDFIQRFLPLVNTFVTIDKIYYNHYIRKGFSTSAKFNTEKIAAKRRIIDDIKNTMKSLNIDTSLHKCDYTYLLLRQYIAPVCSLYSDKECLLSHNEKIEKIKEIKKEPFYFEFCNQQKLWKILIKSKKYAMLYFLFKYGFYGYILRIYRERNKYA